MAIKKLIYLIVFHLLLTSFSAFSQEKEGQKTPLLEIIKQMEEKFEVRFSYADEEMTGVQVSGPDLSLSLESILTSLASETHLLFEKINDRYYTISPKKTQNICGSIMDATNNQPIIGASIEAVAKGKAAISNSKGEFTLENISPKTIIRIRFLSYEPFYTTAERLAKNPCETIRLFQRFEELGEVVVQKYLTTGLNKQNDGSIVINTKDFGILPGLIEPDVLQTIQALPGIESFNETVSNINIRGGTNDQNLILWDGIKMYQSGHFFGLISAFNPYLTEKVTVTKNGTSAAYNDGVSGTVDMQSHNTVADEMFGGAGFNLISADAYAHIPMSKKFGLQVSARRSITDQLKSPTYNQFFERAFQDSKVTNTQNQEVEQNINRNEDFYFYDAGLKVLYDLSKNHKIRSSFIAMNNHLDYEETLTQNDASETKISNLDQQNYAIGGSLESSWNNRFSTIINGYYTHYLLEATNFDLLTDQRLIQNNEVLETGGKLTANYKVFNDINLLNGYQFYEVGISNVEDVNDPKFFRKIKDVVRNHALFSEIKYQSPSKSTFIRTGARLNYIESFGKFILEPRLNFSQKILPNFTAELLAEMKSQVTNQVIDLQRDFLGVEKRRWILSNNTDLPVTQSKQASMGLNYNKNDFYVGVEGFYKKVEGITTSNQGFQNQGQFMRTSGTYDVSGVEFLINKKATRFSTWLSYTYSKNDYTFEELAPSSFPNNIDIRHSVSFAGTYIINKLKLAVGLNWRTGKPYTRPQEGNEVTETNSGNFINYENPNSINLPDYLRADISSNYNFNLSSNVKATLGLAILNMLNRKNTLDIHYQLQNQQSTEVQQVENVSLGVTPNASFRVFF